MRKTLIILAVTLQVLVLLFMAGKREYILRTGNVIWLRTAPIDPRDLFRGDYVRLRYEASAVPVGMASPDLREPDKNEAYGKTVYAALSIDDRGLAEVTGLSGEPPASGRFLKGRLTQPWQLGISSTKELGVTYGLEAYYVQQGKGKDIEKKQGVRTSLQTPLEMEIALGKDGTGVIRSHRFSPLGIGLKLLESPRRDAPQGRKSAKFRLTLKNTSEGPLAIVNLPGLCSLTLEPAFASATVTIPMRPPCTGLVPADSDVVVLKPDEEKQFEIDLAEPQWHVLQNNVLVETGTLQFAERFRLVYRPPAAGVTQHLRDAAMIWHGTLPSRAFYGIGNMD